MRNALNFMGERYLILYIPPMDEIAQVTGGAREMGIALTPGDSARLLLLLDELTLWNRKFNLTAITDRQKMITHHLLDSLSIHAHLSGQTVADVGTGAGFPGLPLALANPSREFTLIDSTNKKVQFVAHAAAMLQLANVTPLHARVERMRRDTPFDTVVARAFAPLPDILELIAPLCGPATRVLAMKGKPRNEEISGISGGWRVMEARQLAVPGLTEARCCIVLERQVASLIPRE
jgi:16S rRNA (guanine527-N7)-methyltransferase